MYAVRKGVSLIEVLITLAVFSLLVLFALPQLTFLRQMTLKTEVEHLYSVCMYLRRKALATGQEQVLVFDVKKNSYTYDNSTYTLGKQVCFGYLSGSKGPPSHASYPLTQPITFVDSRIIFYPTGIIQSGSVYLTDVHKQKMYALSTPVSQVSFLRIYRYDKKWIQV